MAGLHFPQTGEYENTLVARWAGQLSGAPLRPSQAPPRRRAPPRVREPAITDAAAQAASAPLQEQPFAVYAPSPPEGSTPLFLKAGSDGAAPGASGEAQWSTGPPEHATYTIGSFNGAAPGAGWPHAASGQDASYGHQHAAMAPQALPLAYTAAQEHGHGPHQMLPSAAKQDSGAHRFIRMLNTLVPGSSGRKASPPRQPPQPPPSGAVIMEGPNLLHPTSPPTMPYGGSTPSQPPPPPPPPGHQHGHQLPPSLCQDQLPPGYVLVQTPDHMLVPQSMLVQQPDGVAMVSLLPQDPCQHNNPQAPYPPGHHPLPGASAQPHTQLGRSPARDRAVRAPPGPYMDGKAPSQHAEYAQRGAGTTAGLHFDPSTAVPQHFTPTRPPGDPVMVALSQVAFTNELLRRESTARTVGLRSLLDFIYDNFDAFDEASRKVTGHPVRSALRSVLREAAHGGPGLSVAGPNAKLWIPPSPTAKPMLVPPGGHAGKHVVRFASFNVQGLDHRDPRCTNQLYNVAQTLHVARPDIVTLQGFSCEETPGKLAALLNLWAAPGDGTWMSLQSSESDVQRAAHAAAAAASRSKAESRDERRSREGERDGHREREKEGRFGLEAELGSAPKQRSRLQALLWREQLQVITLVPARSRSGRTKPLITLPPLDPTTLTAPDAATASPPPQLNRGNQHDPDHQQHPQQQHHHHLQQQQHHQQQQQHQQLSQQPQQQRQRREGSVVAAPAALAPPAAAAALFRVHGHLVLVASALFLEPPPGTAALSQQQPVGAAAALSQQKPEAGGGGGGGGGGRRSHVGGVAALGQQAGHVLQCVEEVAWQQGELRQEAVCVAVGCSLAVSGEALQRAKPSPGMRAVMQTLAQGGLHPMVDPNVATGTQGNHHLDNLCMRLVVGKPGQDRGRQHQAFTAVQGANGPLGTRHLSAPGHCSHHQLVWADLHAPTTEGLHHMEQGLHGHGRSGYGLGREVGESPPHGRWGREGEGSGRGYDRDGRHGMGGGFGLESEGPRKPGGGGFGLETEGEGGRRGSPLPSVDRGGRGGGSGGGAYDGKSRTYDDDWVPSLGGHGQQQQQRQGPTGTYAQVLSGTGQRGGGGGGGGGYGVFDEDEGGDRRRGSGFGLGAESTPPQSRGGSDRNQGGYGLGAETAPQQRGSVPKQGGGYGLGSEAVSQRGGSSGGVASRGGGGGFGLDEEDDGPRAHARRVGGGAGGFGLDEEDESPGSRGGLPQLGKATSPVVSPSRTASPAPALRGSVGTLGTGSSSAAAKPGSGAGGVASSTSGKPPGGVASSTTLRSSSPTTLRVGGGTTSTTSATSAPPPSRAPVSRTASPATSTGGMARGFLK